LISIWAIVAEVFWFPKYVPKCGYGIYGKYALIGATVMGIGYLYVSACGGGGSQGSNLD